MNKTTEALELAEVALMDVFDDDNVKTALAAIREVLADHIANAGKMVGCAYCDNPLFAGTKCKNCGRVTLAEPVKQETVMDYERLTALREGEQNRAEDDYFNARPHNDTPTLREMFCQGFERGFHKGLKYAAPVSVEAAVLAERKRCAEACYLRAQSWKDNAARAAKLCGDAITSMGDAK